MNIPVRITGADHPWRGFVGRLVGVEKPSIGILPPMGRVVLDDGQEGCPRGHECFVSQGDCERVKETSQ